LKIINIILELTFEKEKDATQPILEIPKELTLQNSNEDMSSMSKQSPQSSAAYNSSPLSESKHRILDPKRSLLSKLLTEQTDSQQSLSTNSRDYFDEETAV
jgi:hypothetical protein